MTRDLETMFGGQKMKQQKQQDQAIPGFINQHVCLYIYACVLYIYIVALNIYIYYIILYVYNNIYMYIYIYISIILYLYITSYVLIIIYNIGLYFYGE
jgi:hypothetical protein